MNRWSAWALGVLVVGLAVAFLVVPYDDGACPTGTFLTTGPPCDAVGSVPRIATIVVTVLISLVLATLGSAGISRRT